jgi:hypothetical protein
VQRLVFALDRYLSRTYGVFEYSHDPQCILRLSLGTAPHLLHVDDQVIEAGEPVLIMHLRNAQLMPVAQGGPDMAWARKMLGRYRLSLRYMAAYIASHDELAGVRAIGGDTSLFLGGEHGSGKKMMQAMGFTLFPYHNRLGSFGEFWENFYGWMLMWAYNPDSLSYRKLWSLKRTEFWVSRDALLRRFGGHDSHELAGVAGRESSL